MSGFAKARSGAFRSIGLLLVPVGGVAQAQAQESEAEKAFEIVNRDAKEKDVFVFDFAVPSSPGLTLLGVDKDKITQSNSLKPFVLSLPGILASDGEGRAVALDGSIGSLLIPASEQRYSDYQANALIYRTRFNAGLSDLREEVGVLWASFRTSFGNQGPDTEEGTTFAEYEDWADNFGRWLMIGGAGRAALKESVATGDATAPQIRADTFALWAGLESYSKTDRLAVQVGREKIEPSDGAHSAFGGTRTVYNASFDQALGESNLWLSISYGKAEGTGFLKSDSTARVTITFNAPTAKNILGGS